MALREKILSLIGNKDMENLKTLLCDSGHIEILQAFHVLSPEEQVIVFRLLAKDCAMSIFEQLDTNEQQNLLRSFTDENVAEFVNEMAPDDRVRLLDEMPAGVAKKLLNSLSPEEREVTNVLMGYEEETAGRIMTTEFISLQRNMTVAQAMAKVRRQAMDKESVYTLYVTDDGRVLEGVLSLKQLICADEDAKIEDVMHLRAISVTTDTDQERVARKMQELDLLALPVVDSEGRIVGIITVDDAMDILENEATEDIYHQAGMMDVKGKEASLSETMIRGNLWSIWKVRVPFLFLTLTAGILGGFLIEGFEETLAAIISVSFFIPLVMDMGGNVGTQSSTVFARGLVLGHIDVKKFFKALAKEAFVGLSMGMIFGGISATIAGIWQGDYRLGLAVGVAVAFTMTLAAILGFLVPYILVRLRMDQAAGSAPLITSIKDIAGLLIYFLVVRVFLSHALQEASEYTGYIIDSISAYIN